MPYLVYYIICNDFKWLNTITFFIIFIWFIILYCMSTYYKFKSNIIWCWSQIEDHGPTEDKWEY